MTTDRPGGGFMDSDDRHELEDKSTKQPASSRLGIRHLLLLTTATAIALTVDEWLLDSQQSTKAGQIVRKVYCLIYGFALTGLLVFFSRHARRHSAALVHPGHVFLVLAGCGAVVDGLVELVIMSWISLNGIDVDGVNGYRIDYVKWLCHQAIGYTIITGVCVWLMSRFTWPRRWKNCFAGLLVTFASQSVAYWLTLAGIFAWLPNFLVQLELSQHLMIGCSFACTILFVIAMIIDLRIGVRRDWLHFCGLAASLLLASMEWVRYYRTVVIHFL